MPPPMMKLQDERPRRQRRPTLDRLPEPPMKSAGHNALANNHVSHFMVASPYPAGVANSGPTSFAGGSLYSHGGSPNANGGSPYANGSPYATVGSGNMTGGSPYAPVGSQYGTANSKFPTATTGHDFIGQQYALPGVHGNSGPEAFVHHQNGSAPGTPLHEREPSQFKFAQPARPTLDDVDRLTVYPPTPRHEPSPQLQNLLMPSSQKLVGRSQHDSGDFEEVPMSIGNIISRGYVGGANGKSQGNDLRMGKKRGREF